jgi:hypothetical protein
MADSVLQRFLGLDFDLLRLEDFTRLDDRAPRPIFLRAVGDLRFRRCFVALVDRLSGSCGWSFSVMIRFYPNTLREVHLLSESE